MTKASLPNPQNTAPAAQTIRADEAAHFGALAADWWDPKGSSAMLHRLNPVRLGYIRERIDAHFGMDGRALKPLAGRRALDVGCGAGLLCEPLARMGASVTGVDAAAENVAVASAHAAAGGLPIDYRHGDIGAMGLHGFDLVTSMEVIEHVADPALFLRALADALAPGGLMILSTPNRTMQSRLLLVEAAERIGQVPRGTHHWDQFITPDELEALANDAGLRVIDRQGLGFSILRGLELSEDMTLNYLMALVRA